MKPRYKVGNIIYVFSTQYLDSIFDDHPEGKATIKEIIKSSEWHNQYVPEYLVTMGKKTYHIPQYSADETGMLENKLKHIKKAPKRKA